MTYANPQAAGQTTGTNNPGISSSESMNQAPSAGFVAGGIGGGQATQLSDYKIIRRNGSVVAFEPAAYCRDIFQQFSAIQLQQRSHPQPSGACSTKNDTPDHLPVSIQIGPTPRQTNQTADASDSVIQRGSFSQSLDSR